MLLMANPTGAKAEFNQEPFPVSPGGTSEQMCNDCVISASMGYKCMPEYNGYTSCASGMVYSYDPVTGEPRAVPFCSINASSVCYTIIP